METELTNPFEFVIRWLIEPFVRMVDYFEADRIFAGLLMLVLAVVIYMVLFFGIRSFIYWVRARSRRPRRSRRRY